MSWNYTDHFDDCAAYDAAADKIDQLARTLAKAAGEDWDRMNNFPGYQKNKWRETAEMVMA